jgi:hypothetical protein
MDSPTSRGRLVYDQVNHVISTTFWEPKAPRVIAMQAPAYDDLIAFLRTTPSYPHVEARILIGEGPPAPLPLRIAGVTIQRVEATDGSPA